MSLLPARSAHSNAILIHVSHFPVVSTTHRLVVHGFVSFTLSTLEDPVTCYKERGVTVFSRFWLDYKIMILSVLPRLSIWAVLGLAMVNNSGTDISMQMISGLLVWVWYCLMTKRQEWVICPGEWTSSWILKSNIEVMGVRSQRRFIKELLIGGSLWTAQMSKAWVMLVWNSGGYFGIKTYSVFFF